MRPVQDGALACPSGRIMTGDYEEKRTMDIQATDDLLRRVHARLGGLGVDIKTFGDGAVEATWVRSYDGVWSDSRWTSGASLAEVLQGILDYEDRADAQDAAEAAV